MLERDTARDITLHRNAARAAVFDFTPLKKFLDNWLHATLQRRLIKIRLDPQIVSRYRVPRSPS